MTAKSRILVYGYGNPGRQDDGLGVAFAAELQAWLRDHKMAHVSVDSNYQLNIEDAVAVAENDIVIFVDASTAAIDCFRLTDVAPSHKVAFTMHAVGPAFILALCRELYNKCPETYILQIKGYEWGMRETLTPGARQNLDQALAFLQAALQELENQPASLKLSAVNP